MLSRSFFFSACVCVMARVWRSEDNFARVSHFFHFYCWLGMRNKRFYAHKTTSLALLSSSSSFFFDLRGAASWIQRTWLHTGDISELWRTPPSPMFRDDSRKGARRTYSPQRAVDFLVSRHRAPSQKPVSCTTGGLQICGCFPQRKVFRTGTEPSSF